MKFDWNYIIPALIPALISMVSLYLQIKQNKKMLNANVIVAHRLSWMKDVRKLSGDYVAEASKINAICYFLIKSIDNNDEEYKKLIDEFIEVRDNLYELYFNLLLYFSDDNKYREVIGYMDDFQKKITEIIQYEKDNEGLNPSYISESELDTNLLQSNIVKEIRNHLENEWKQAKKDVA